MLPTSHIIPNQPYLVFFQVKEIFVNPNYNASTFSRDLAILELREPVTYSDWVRPACLWPNNEVELKNVIGKKGSVCISYF